MKIRKISALLMAFSIMSGVLFTGCNGGSERTHKKTKESEHNVTGKVERNVMEVSEVTEDSLNGYTEFGLKLLQQSFDGGNVMISPLSLITALGMTANGANGQTRSEMEDVFGMSVEDVNRFVYSIGEGDGILSSANGIWLNNRRNIVLRDDYVQSVTDWYGAPIMVEEFDGNTIDEINSFVNENTDGQIPELITDLSPAAQMVLVNAINFNADWDDPFEADSIHERDFTAADGSIIPVQMMYQQINGYIGGDNETGFIKLYDDCDYGFVALLPDESLTIEDYVNDLTSEEILALISGIRGGDVDIGLPQFEMDYSCDMAVQLAEAGMPSAFEETADFTNMVDMSQMDSDFIGLYIDQVIHKTHIRVDSQGTQAAAATAVVMNEAMCAEVEELPPRVILDRPFVYMIVDTENNIPVFMGVYTGN